MKRNKQQLTIDYVKKVCHNYFGDTLGLHQVLKFWSFQHLAESHGKLNFYYDDKQFVNNIFSMKTNFVYVFH